MMLTLMAETTACPTATTRRRPTRNWSEKKVKMRKKGGYDFSRMKKSGDADHINKTNGVVIAEFDEGKGTFLMPWGAVRN